ncbi:MAG: alpha/beta fold hydrolase [Sphingomonadaceae bacterium]|nr:alpha/beta fold hydrolase [Sphingomonadaceae bacterium]
MEQRRRTVAEGEIATVEDWTAGPRAPLVHFAHATGMAAGLYASLVERLVGRVNVVASDARGHGATMLPFDPAALSDWSTFADDLAALLAMLPPAPRLVLAGHSMGATVSAELAARRDDVAALVLIEPAFVPFAVAAAYDRAAWPNPMAAQAAKRRAVWPSRAAMREAWVGRGVFATWADADLARYLAYGVRDRADGQVELACAPAWEAATFAAVSTGLEDALAAWGGPLTLLHATERSTVTAEDAAAIAARPATTVRAFPGRDHFLPLAEPQGMADAILAAAFA